MPVWRDIVLDKNVVKGCIELSPVDINSAGAISNDEAR